MGIKVRLPIPLSVIDIGANRWKVCLNQYYIETTLSESKNSQIICPSKQKDIDMSLMIATKLAIKEGFIIEGTLFKLQLKVFGIERIALHKDLMTWSIFLCFAYFKNKTINRDSQHVLLNKLYKDQADLCGTQATILGGLSVINSSNKENKSFRLPVSSKLYIAVIEKEIRLIEDSSDFLFDQFSLQHALTMHSVDLIKSSLIDINAIENINQNTKDQFSSRNCLGVIRTKEKINLFIFSTSLALEQFIQNTSAYIACTLNSEGAIKC